MSDFVSTFKEWHFWRNERVIDQVSGINLWRGISEFFVARKYCNKTNREENFDEKTISPIFISLRLLFFVLFLFPSLSLSTSSSNWRSRERRKKRGRKNRNRKSLYLLIFTLLTKPPVFESAANNLFCYNCDAVLLPCHSILTYVYTCARRKT